MTQPHSLITRPPISIRLALWSTLAVLVAIVLLGGAMTLSLRSGLRDRAHESLEVPFRVVEHHLATHPETSLAELLDVTIPGAETRDEVIGQILDSSGSVVDSTGQPATLEPMVGQRVLTTVRRGGEWHEPRRLTGRDADDIVVVLPILEGATAGGFVVMAQTLEASEAEVGRMVQRFLLLVPLVLLASFIGAWTIARSALRPVDALTRQATTIDPELTDTQLPVPRGDDEVTRLAVALNEMLARLRLEIERERRFSADTSHELRTPLALMSAELDVSLRSPSTPSDVLPILTSLRADVGRLSRIVEDLLLLSRSDANGHVELAVEDIDLLDLAVTVASRFRPMGASRGIAIEVAGAPAVASADPQLLSQAIANLVDNSLKFSDTGTTITINVSGGDNAPAVTVSDEGLGIASESQALIFDRFYQVDPARTAVGSGLGLAIVDSIIRAHHGTLTVESAEGAGSAFTLELPGRMTS